MSILYDEGQIAIATESKKVLEARYSKDKLLELLEDQGRYDDTFWQTCIEQGWTGITIPEEYDGLGLGLLELGIIAEACGNFCVGAPFLTTTYGVSETLLNYGSEALKAELLPMLARGEAIGCVAFAEKGETLPKSPKLSFSGNSVKGTKPAVPGGAAANIAVALAEQNGVPVLVAVKLTDNAVTKKVLETFDNTRCAADLEFDGAEAEILVSGPEAIEAAKTILARMAVITAHEQTGGAGALMYISRDYALERKAFGQPIGGFQSVKHRIAEMYVLVELARANAIHAAASVENDDFLAAAAAARLTATEAYDTSARDTVQVHGGIGVTWESGLHLHQRRTRTLAIEGGSTTFWEDLLVDEIAEEVV